MASSLSEELLAIRLELKGVREAVSGLHQVDKAQKGIATTTTKTGAAAEKAEKKTSRLSRAYASLGKTARWGIGFLGVGAVFAFKSAIDNAEELAKTTIGLTRNLGLQTNVASRWAAVAHARDIDSKALSTTFGVLSSKMVEAARKGGTLLTPFHQLGLTQEDAAKGARNFQWGLLRIVKALGEEEGGTKRMAAAKALLGKGFQSLLPMFSGGVKGLKEQLHWADKYGVTLDGKTNKSLMDMVNAQRESKVAVLGLQLALTKALMPAIEGGQHELQRFIGTLNDPKLTADQKISRIEKQFEELEDALVEAVADALPKIAENGGVLGLKLAGAIWTGFTHSGLLGKLVISAWLLKFMGGGGLIRSVAGKAGKAIAMGILARLAPVMAAELLAGSTLGQVLTARFKGLGRASGLAFTGAFLLATVGIGFLLAEKLDERTDGAFRQWGVNAGQNFVNMLIKIINAGIREINSALDKANVLSALGVDAPNIGEVGEVDWHPGDEGHPKRSDGKPNLLPPMKNPFAPIGQKRPNTGARRPLILHTHVHLDGKEVAESTAYHAEMAAALA